MNQWLIKEPRLIGRSWIPNALAEYIAKLYWRILASRPGAKPKILFILSHQRSGSSLLVHCLNTNPSVIGYGETLLHYGSERDFYRLPFLIMKVTRRPVILQKYVTDKLLYDELLRDACLLRSPKVYSIFLLREPAAALASLIRAPKLDGWPQRPEANKDYVDQEICEKYYTTRLATLEQYAKSINNKNRSLFITYEDIVERTDRAFYALGEFLGIAGQFSDEYETLDTTGKAGFGDTSENISAGRVLRSIRRPHCELRNDLLKKAEGAFRSCSAVLRQYCSVIDG